MENKLRYFLKPSKILQAAKSYFLTKPTRNSLIASWLRTLAQPANPEKWVFIVGCYNSGTTLLERLLSTHSKISALDEGVFRTDELLTPEELGWTRMWYKVKDQVRLKAQDQGPDVDILKKDWSIFFDHSKPVFLEKSIVNSARMLWLQENFENSYFIFIVRNGYAVAEGIKRKASKERWGIQKERYKPSYPIEMCAKQWVESNKIIEKDAQSINNFKKIYYEDLCKHPNKTVRKIWDFIGFNQTPNLDSAKKWQIQEKNLKIENMNNSSFSQLSKQDIEIIEKKASKILKFYNYLLLSSTKK